MKQVALKIIAPESVYPPAEDTYLLADAIKLNPKDSFLEVGCGSGYVAINAAKITDNVVANDISLEAVRVTMKNALRNRVFHLLAFQGDLLTAISPKRKFTVIAFNPPYLPSDKELSELDETVIGGRLGTELTERFIMQAIYHLTDGGSLYIVASSLANIERIKGVMKAHNLKDSIIASRRLFYEKLVVLRGTNEHKEMVL